MERAHPDHSLISSNRVADTPVYGAGDAKIGSVDHLMIDKVSGRIAYAVISFGGFMGLAHSHYPVPWGALRYAPSLGGYKTDITQEQLEDAPEFSDDEVMSRDRAWEQRTHQHYDTPVYWGV